MVFFCAECGCESDEKALGWVAFLADLDDDGEDEAAFFCQRCAAREFGYVKH